MIKLENICKSFGDSKVLDNCSCNLYSGNIYVLKGKSGSGKTTLLNIIALLDNKFDGTYNIDGINLKNANKKKINKIKKKISYVMQKNLYYKKISLLENLLMVNKDKDRIMELAKQFDVLDLINMHPNEISGGELQRFSIIRALLLDSSILIFDEPTSNLDLNNSKQFAKYIGKISKENKIIIIATHKNIYDEMADEIINIEYGKINIRKNNIKENSDKINFNKSNNKKKISNLIIKNRYKESIFTKCFFVILISLILISLSFYFNYRRELIKNNFENKTYHVIDVGKDKVDKIKEYYKIKKTYNNYTFDVDGYAVYPLFDYEDSIFKEDNVIFLGNFPKDENEVLVNAQFARSHFVVDGLVNYDNALGSELNIDGKKYVISGLVGEDNINVSDLYKNTQFYLNIYGSDGSVLPAIFMNYDELSKIGTLKDDIVMISFDAKDLENIYEKNDFNQSLFYDSNSYMAYQNKISQVYVKTESPTKVAIILCFILMILSFFFMINEVSLNIYYKKREIGHLQLLQYSKSDVEIILIVQYLLNITVNIIIGILIYLLAVYYINKKYNLFLLLQFKQFLIIILLLYIYNYLIILFSIRKITKQNVIDLIKN